MKVDKALGSSVVIEIPEVDEKIGSGILFSAVETAKPPQIGKVVAVGPNWMDKQIHELNEGDSVLFALSAEQPGRVFELDGKNYMTLAHEEVIAIL